MGHTVPKRLSPVSGQEASVTPRLTTSPRSGVAGGLRPHGPHIPSAWACDWPQLMTEDLRSAPCYDLKHHVEDPTGAEQSQQLCCQWTLPCGEDGEILPPAKPWGSCPNCHWSRHEWGPGNICPSWNLPSLPMSHPRPDTQGWQRGKSLPSGQVTEALSFDSPFCERERITSALSASQTGC